MIKVRFLKKHISSFFSLFWLVSFFFLSWSSDLFYLGMWRVGQASGVRFHRVCHKNQYSRGSWVAKRRPTCLLHGNAEFDVIFQFLVKEKCKCFRQTYSCFFSWIWHSFLLPFRRQGWAQVTTCHGDSPGDCAAGGSRWSQTHAEKSLGWSLQTWPCGFHFFGLVT